MISLFAHFIQSGDDSRTVTGKKLLVVACLACFVVNARVVAEKNLFVKIRTGLTIATSLAIFLQLVVERRIRNTFTEVMLYFVGAGTIMNDFYVSVGNEGSYWPYFVVFVDICLVCRLPHRVSVNLIIMLSMYLLVTAFEAAFRFGLYDLPFLPSQESRRSLVDCQDIPCPTGIEKSGFKVLDQLAVLILDFYFTRGFANDLHKEQDKMNKVIHTAESIATSLSNFDLAEAESIISTALLPPPLYDAFNTILSNLEGYRPFLPDALFHELHKDAHGHKGHDIPAPGLQTSEATIVFTDIQGSTATWEACPEGMKEALQVHNEVVRTSIAEHNGYEVKTIGDAFMVAFENASDAVWFGLSVQENLVESIWPQELLSLRQYAYDDEGPWCGLRVRIGVHCGEVDVQLNTLTNRYDYFGNTVNKAARIEGVCIGGSVAVTPEVLEKIGPLDGASVIPMGLTQLKGIGETIHPFLLLSENLVGRKLYVENQLQNGKSDWTLMLDDVVSSRGSTRASSARESVRDSESSFRGLGAKETLEVRTSSVAHVDILVGYDEEAEDILNSVCTGALRITVPLLSLGGASMACGSTSSPRTQVFIMPLEVGESDSVPPENGWVLMILKVRPRAFPPVRHDTDEEVRQLKDVHPTSHTPGVFPCGGVPHEGRQGVHVRGPLVSEGSVYTAA